MSNFFTIKSRDQKTRARTGVITTPHGTVETPSYVIVGTDAAVRCLEPADIPETKTQMIISNTYHLWRQWDAVGLDEFPGLHKEMGWQGTIMTDSGGFQVFSLGAAREHRIGKVDKEQQSDFRSGESIVRVTDSGVYFEEAGEELYLDAELSMRIQEQLGADIIFAFDEPSSPHHDYEYTKKTVERTHAWAERSLEAKTSGQFLYGIVQGGAFEDLRRESAKVISALPFDGLSIGGSFGSSFGSTTNDSMRELEWTLPLLPDEKPRHLLGMGKIEDLLYGVEAGIDTFDCVIPTREARHGALWTAEGRIDITKGRYAADDGPIDESCNCTVCSTSRVSEEMGEGNERGASRAVLHALFKEKSPEAGRLATMHNIYFFNNFMEDVRNAINEGRFSEFKKSWLKKLKAVHK